MHFFDPSRAKTFVVKPPSEAKALFNLIDFLMVQLMKTEELLAIIVNEPNCQPNRTIKGVFF